jgi:hypothetical protein
MNFSFFEWIRQGVKQSVLLGVSDAAEIIGDDKDVEELNGRFLESIQQTRLAKFDDSNGSPGGRTQRARKPLGRSLTQVMEDQDAA